MKKELDLLEGPLIITVKETKPLISKELSNFIHGFLFGDGEIVDDTLVCCSPRKSYVLWLKDCFNRFGISSSIKKEREISRGKPALWTFRTESLVLTKHFKKIWYVRGNHKSIKDTTIIKSSIVLFFWFLVNGICYEFNGCKHIEISRWLLTNTLKSLGIEVIVRRSRIHIQEKYHTKFFEYILSHDYSIPECYKDKFPATLLTNHMKQL